MRIEIRPTALLRYHAHTHWTLTYDVDFQSQASHGQDTHAYTHNFKFKGQSVQKMEGKQSDRHT